MSSTAPFLLVLGCSKRKRPHHGVLPAIERYDGPNYRVLRKARREGSWPPNLEVLIVSAKHGLISAEGPIGNYDLLLTRERASALQQRVGRQLDSHLERVEYREVFINLGRIYLLTLTHSARLPLLSRVLYASGGIGQRMSQMKAWLGRVSGRG